MQIIRDIANVKLEKAVLTTGNFDGVHLGHQFLLERLVDEAKQRQCPSVVVMFDPHPREVLGRADDLRYLCDETDKMAIIESCGIDIVVLLPFSKELASWSAKTFVSTILVDKLGMDFFLVGYNHRIGNPTLGGDLKEIAQELGFDLQSYMPFFVDEDKVSSSIIRQELIGGNLSQATHLLGRTYSINCVVVEGAKVGRSIGYRTANLKPLVAKMLIPAEGVYAVRVRIDDTVFGGMLQIGHRPTLDDDRGQTVEVHIFDFDRTIYSEHVTLEFLFFMRDNQRFDSLDELKRQLSIDEKDARQLLQ